MREKTLKILEFDKVLNLIQEYAGSKIGKERVLNLKPSTSILKIKDAQKKLSDALEVGGEFGYPEFSTLEDIRGEIHISCFANIFFNYKKLAVDVDA